jgi:hypothetical protein
MRCVLGVSVVHVVHNFDGSRDGRVHEQISLQPSTKSAQTLTPSLSAECLSMCLLYPAQVLTTQCARPKHNSPSRRTHANVNVASVDRYVLDECDHMNVDRCECEADRVGVKRNVYPSIGNTNIC